MCALSRVFSIVSVVAVEAATLVPRAHKLKLNPPSTWFWKEWRQSTATLSVTFPNGVGQFPHNDWVNQKMVVTRCHQSGSCLDTIDTAGKSVEKDPVEKAAKDVNVFSPWAKARWENCDIHGSCPSRKMVTMRVMDPIDPQNYASSAPPPLRPVRFSVSFNATGVAQNWFHYFNDSNFVMGTKLRMAVIVVAASGEQADHKVVVYDGNTTDEEGINAFSWEGGYTPEYSCMKFVIVKLQCGLKPDPADPTKTPWVTPDTTSCDDSLLGNGYVEHASYAMPHFLMSQAVC